MATGFYLDPNSQSQRITCYLCLCVCVSFSTFCFSSLHRIRCEMCVRFFSLRFRRFVAPMLFFMAYCLDLFGLVFGFYCRFTIVVLVVSLTAVDKPVCRLHYWFCFHLEHFSVRISLSARPICWPTRFHQTLFRLVALKFFQYLLNSAIWCSFATYEQWACLDLDVVAYCLHAAIAVTSCNYYRRCRCVSSLMLLIFHFYVFVFVFVSLCRCRYIVN